MTTRIWESNRGDVSLLGVVEQRPTVDGSGDALVSLTPEDAISRRLFDLGQMSKEQRKGISHMLTVDEHGERHTGLLKSWTLAGKSGERRMDVTFVDQDSFLASIRASL